MRIITSQQKNAQTHTHANSEKKLVAETFKLRQESANWREI